MKNSKKEKNKGQIAKMSNLLKSYLALKAYTRYGNIQGMYRNLQNLKPIYKKKADYYLRLSKLAYEQKMWKQSLEYIDTAIRLTNNSFVKEYHLLKANNLIHLGKSTKAISSLNNYLSTQPNDARIWYKLANEYKKNKQWKKTIDSFESYLKLKPKDSKAYLELADCYRKLSDYQNAKINYKEAVNNLDQSSNRKLLVSSYYWLGCMQLEKNSIEANKSFKKVLTLDKELNSEKYGIGIFHEYYKQWNSAVEAYKKQILENDQVAEIYFKLAYILDEKLYSPEQALAYYEKALELDKVLSPWHFALANCYEQLNDYYNAAIWFESAIARQGNHRPGNYRRLGLVYSQLGRTKDALGAFKEAEIFSKANFIDGKFYKKHINKATVRYAISYEHYSIDNQIIFYESLSGARMMDSPFAIFENIFNKSNFKNYTHVWVVNSYHVIPDKYRSINNIIFVKRKSDAYFKYISSSKYLICNSTFDPYVVRKPNQLYLQTSHGIFYKTVGRDSVGSPIGVAGSTRNLLQATHIIVPNEYMSEKQPKSYSIRGIHSGEIAKIGYPRIDVTLNITDEAKRQIASRLGIQTTKKIVLYVPTWRGETKSDNRFDSNQLIEDLNRLAELDVNVVFRGHAISNRLLKNTKFPENVIIPPADILTNELLGLADIVISDYSSVFFDFLVTNRPIIHYLYDVDVYTKERGLNLTEDELPGTVVKTSEQLKAAVASKLEDNTPSSHYLAAKKRFCPYDDGRSTERVVEWFFYDNSADVNFVSESNSAKSLYLIGNLRDKIKFSKLVSDLNNRQESDDISSLLFSSQVSKNKDKRSLVSELDSNVNFIVHDKNMPTTIEDAFAINYFQSNGEFLNKRMEATYNHAYRREARRLFGDSEFNQIHNYETDSDYYNGLQENIIIKNI